MYKDNVYTATKLLLCEISFQCYGSIHVLPVLLMMHSKITLDHGVLVLQLQNKLNS